MGSDTRLCTYQGLDICEAQLHLCASQVGAKTANVTMNMSCHYDKSKWVNKQLARAAKGRHGSLHIGG